MAFLLLVGACFSPVGEIPCIETATCPSGYLCRNGHCVNTTSDDDDAGVDDAGHPRVDAGAADAGIADGG